MHQVWLLVDMESLQRVQCATCKLPVKEVVSSVEAFLVDNKLLASLPSQRVTAQEITRTQIGLIEGLGCS